MRPIFIAFVAISVWVLSMAGATPDAWSAAGEGDDVAGARAAADVLPLDQWTYINVDNSRATRAFGLDMADATGDGYGDIVSGQYFYRNPGGSMTAPWTRVTLPNAVDAVLFVDVDGDDRADVIAQKTSGSLTFYWLEANDTQGASWSTAATIGNVPAASHSLGSQGHRIAQIEAGGRPEIVVSSGNGLYYFEIPANPSAGSWPVTHVNANPTDEGIGVGDIDGDGDLDLAAGTGSTKRVEWYENPGDGSAGWTAYHIGDMSEALWTDRFAIVDLDGDDQPDIVGTEENGSTSGAQTWWWEQPSDPKSGGWTRREIVSQATTNSMDTADMDNDGDIDVVLAEHRGSLKLAIWENDGSGNFTERVVDTGKESHLGAKVADLDGDGDLEIVSIAWDAYQNLHLWRNDALDFSPAQLQGYSASYHENARGVELRWHLADVGVDMKFYVLRAEGGGAAYSEIHNPGITGGDMTYAFVDKTARPGATYRYRVDVSDELGRRTLFETSAVEIPVASITLNPGVPNPFNPQTTITYATPEAGRVVLRIYDAGGRLVRTLVDGLQEAGPNEATWDGKDSNGMRVSSGVYFARLEF
ncbi:MAG: FG-GAP-like repeat-containing protein, partial [Candidatus Latescibacterota bacterium]